MNRKFISQSNRILKKILNSEENLDILQDFIETFLKIKIKEIKINPYLERKANQLPAEENFGIASVRVKLEQEELNIGIQFIDGYYPETKMLLYYSQIHLNQLEYPENQKKVKTITINLLDFICLNSKRYLNRIIIPSKTEKEIEMYVLELPKFLASAQNEIKNKQDAWVCYLCGKPEEYIASIRDQFPFIKKLDNLLEEYWKNEVME